MIQYLFILVLIFILMYLVNNKIIEPFDQIGTSSSPSVNLDFPQIIFLTNNQINYDLLDKEIENINRQYMFLNENTNNFTINTGNVGTTLGNIDKNASQLYVFGSYPNDININFWFAYPLPGQIGEKGDKGDKGIRGVKRNNGHIGNQGGNNYA
jgi:hypothetical protein